MKKDKKPLEATTLRSVLITFVVIALAAASAGFYFGLSWLQSYANEVNATVVQSGTSGQSLGSLGGLQTDLAGRKDVIAKVDALFAPTSNFQTQAIKDINAYADASGISSNISDISLSSGATTPPAGGVAASASTLTIAFSGPVSYRNLVTFVTYLQNSTPKLQVAGIEITRIADGADDLVTVSSINVEVATR
jgi:hypothetical protein